MKILLSHSYRTDMLEKRSDCFIQIMASEDVLQEDIQCADAVFATTHKTRISDLLQIVEDPEKRPDVLINTASFDDRCMEEAAIIPILKEKGIRVIGHSLEICELCRDKARTKAFLRQIRIPVLPDLSLHDQDLAFPIVVKPIGLWAGQGVEILATREEVDDYLQKGLDTDGLLVEPFIEGVEMSVQAIRYGNKTIICPPVYKGYTSEEMVHPLKKLRIFPNPWNPEKNKILMNVAEKITNALQAEGVLDIEFVVKEDQFYVIEINSRLSGVSRMVGAGGINAMNLLVSMATGEWEQTAKQNLCTTAEVPFSANLTEEILNQLRQKEFISYIYIRADGGSNKRQRLLVVANSLTKLASHLQELDMILAFDEALFDELAPFVQAEPFHELEGGIV